MSMKTGQTIRALPADVAAKIKSSTSITDLHGVVLELAKNSLDAGAQIISISVDLKRGGCIVEDDGLGILPEEFEPHGGLGKPHRKYSSFRHFGDFLTLIFVQTRPNSALRTCMVTGVFISHLWHLYPCLL